MMSQRTYTDDETLMVTFTENGVAYTLAGRMGEQGAELMSVEMEADRPLVAADLRAPLISTFMTNFALTEGEIKPEPLRRRRGTRPGSAAARLDEVARIAREAGYGERTRAVAAALHVSKGYARQLIASAKAKGLQVWP